ncbi:hypothetical protein OU415_07255 [Saccharopolyspora sp. WRP15-2]|uniref:Uncharacterized protein n=1 Tax=Saccharopolyspora oryzae TaxID=2997343 RepID=A0ABT4UU24_9PSEU|nr:hypothetical protein [Saccharopolyspora oryzae]MDA3625226.1 hypothetical protein [Saccharopolyspora oryzae]
MATATPGPHDAYTARQRLAAIKGRAELDAAYAAEVHADPAAAMRAAGFADTEASALSTAHAAAADDPAGVLGTCFDTTCAVSICPPTCVVSIPAIPGVCQQPGSDCHIFSVF